MKFVMFKIWHVYVANFQNWSLLKIFLKTFMGFVFLGPEIDFAKKYSFWLTNTTFLIKTDFKLFGCFEGPKSTLKSQIPQKCPILGRF